MLLVPRDVFGGVLGFMRFGAFNSQVGFWFFVLGFLGFWGSGFAGVGQARGASLFVLIFVFCLGVGGVGG